MQHNSNTWKVVGYLKRCKERMPSFDFRVKYALSGKPLAIMWMTHNMRYNLLRYSRVLFLDAQKRQMNIMGWPYIGPVVINNEYHVTTCYEAIVTSEDIETYTWIIQAMASIETDWSMSDIKIIFADGLLTNKFLVDLNICKGCILHGDYHHFYTKVWPNSANFGSVIFSKIKSPLQKMFLSGTRSE